MPDLPDLLAQGAGTPVTALDLPSLRARVRQRRRRHRAGVAALLLVPVLLGGSTVVALQDRGEQTLVPAVGVADGESLGLLLSVTDGHDPILTWQPLGRCTMQRERGRERSCVVSADLPPQTAQVSAPLGDLGPRLVVPSFDQPVEAKPVDVLRGYLADPELPPQVHLTIAKGQVVALNYREVATYSGMSALGSSPDGVYDADLIQFLDPWGPADGGPGLVWDPLRPCGPGEPVAPETVCRDVQGAPHIAPLADSPDIVLAAPGQGQGMERLRTYLADLGRANRVAITVVGGEVVRVSDAAPAAPDPPR